MESNYTVLSSARTQSRVRFHGDGRAEVCWTKPVPWNVLVSTRTRVLCAPSQDKGSLLVACDECLTTTAHYFSKTTGPSYSILFV